MGFGTIHPSAPPTTMSNAQWAALVLSDGGWPVTNNNVNSILQWMASENAPATWTGTAGANNPLNNGLGSGGGDGTGPYPDLTVAAKEVVDELNGAPGSGLTGGAAAVLVLQQNGSQAAFQAAIVATNWSSDHYGNGSRWHTGVGDIAIVDAAASQANGAKAPVVIGSGTLVDITGLGNSVTTGGPTAVPTLTPIPIPPALIVSDISKGSFIINGQTMDVDVSAALVNISIEYDITQASTLVMTLEDPDRTIINNPVFAQASTISLLGADLFTWQLVAVEKQSNRVTVTFEPYVVAALRSPATQVPFSVAPGQQTRSQFASLLISQVVGAHPVVASQAFIASIPTTNGQPAGITQEQLSRGTIQNIYEDSWTCLQRLASEIQWVCFEYQNYVYFGPQEYLAEQTPFQVQEFQDGVLNIDGTYDTGQPLGTATINAVAGNWVLGPGQAIAINNLGPFSQAASFVYSLHPDTPPAVGQNWIVATVARASVFEPDIVITLQQALPSLPEPASGGAAAAVAPGIAPGAVGPQPTAQGVNYWPVPPPGTNGAPVQNRVDQGVDWGQSGNGPNTYPIYAVAAGTIAYVSTTKDWPGGTFIVLQLANPPDSTHTAVYYAEYITPSVTTGQVVKGGDTIGQANGGSGSGGSGIEVGWADPTAFGQSLNTKLHGQYSGSGPTPEGTSFLGWITSGGTPSP